MKKAMNITLEQQKLISTPLRIKIIYLLVEQAMTAKQVAEELGKTPGSIHYHIQKLYKGGILEIEETRENKGIVEKYYRSKAAEFHSKNQAGSHPKQETHSRGSTLDFTTDELKEFEDEFGALLKKWVKRNVKPKKGRVAYEVYCQFTKLEEEEGDG